MSWKIAFQNKISLGYRPKQTKDDMMKALDLTSIQGKPVQMRTIMHIAKE